MSITAKQTYTIEESNLNFIKKQIAKRERSAFINRLIEQERKRRLKEAMIRANKEEAQDVEYQKELALWDSTLSDGLNNE